MGKETTDYGAQSVSCPDGVLSKPHAVVTAGANTYCYDRNGSMVRRNDTVYTLSYEAENRLAGVSGGGAGVTFVSNLEALARYA